jgi:hypothetical protein
MFAIAAVTEMASLSPVPPATFAIDGWPDIMGLIRGSPHQILDEPSTLPLIENCLSRPN